MIISGITISSFTGENGIISRARDSKNRTNEVEEKEILNTSTAASIGKSQKAKVEEPYLKNYLNQNVGEETKDYLLEKEERHYNITFVATGNKYIVLEDGTVLTQEEYDNKFKAGFKDTIVVEVGEHKSVSVDTETDSTINWKCDNEKIAKINVNISNIKEVDILGVTNGKTTLTAKLPNGEKWIFEILVQTSPKSISLNSSEILLDTSTKNSETLKVEYEPISVNANKTITWESSAPEIATVDENGVVIAIAPGEATITAKTSNEKTATCKVTVQTSPVGVILDKTNEIIDLSENSKLQLTATITPSNSNIQKQLAWESSKTEIATVDENGLVTGKANGTTTITVKTANDKTAICEITVQTSPESITLNKTNETLDLNGTSTVQLVATINPGTANVNRDITWSSSDSSKVKVDSNGNTATITALSNTATNSPVKITATAQNGNMAQCSVIVKTSLTGLTVSPTSKTLTSGQTVTLTATKTPSSATEGLTWSSGNTSVATVSSSGVVTAKSAGTTTITVKGSSNNVYASCTITVKNKNIVVGTGDTYYGYLIKFDSNGNSQWNKSTSYRINSVE